MDRFNPRLPNGRRQELFFLLACLEAVSIHASQTGGDDVTGLMTQIYNVSIHASQTGGDLKLKTISLSVKFQSTPPKREATCRGGSVVPGLDVSIHASQTGGDDTVQTSRFCLRRFNPRLPNGRRRAGDMVPRVLFDVSIHASQTGGDAVSVVFILACHPFQSTPPKREATIWCDERDLIPCVSIHASQTGGDQFRN